MENTNSSLLPHVLEALSRSPELSDTFDNLCQEIGEHLATEYGNVKTADVRKALRRSLKVGHNLGIVTMVDNIVHMPFKLNRDKRNVREMDDADDSLDDFEEDTVKRRSTSRRKSRKPRKLSSVLEINLGKRRSKVRRSRSAGGRSKSTKTRSRSRRRR